MVKAISRSYCMKLIECNMKQHAKAESCCWKHGGQNAASSASQEKSNWESENVLTSDRNVTPGHNIKG